MNSHGRKSEKITIVLKRSTEQNTKSMKTLMNCFHLTFNVVSDLTYQNKPCRCVRMRKTRLSDAEISECSQL